MLPKIISTLKEWMKKLKPVFDTLKSWVKGVVEFFKWVGDGINKFLGSITGDNATVDAEKKKLKDANKSLKGAFNKQKKGYSDLEQKAKGEEKNLKKDMDDLNKEVDNELDASEKVDPIQVLDDNKDLIPPGMGGVVENEVRNNPSNYNTKGKINSALSNVGVDSSKVKYRTRTIKSDLSTITFDGKTYPRGKPGLGGYIPGDGKGGSTYGNLKADSTTKNRVVTFDVPYTSPKNGGGQGGNSSSSTPVKQSDPDSVNSSELMLNSIEK